MRLRIVLAVIVVLALAAGAAAQTTTGTISGRVLDTQGAALPGAIATATSPNLQGTREAVTSENGDYILTGLPSGPYTITFSMSGFQTQTRNVVLAPDPGAPARDAAGPGAGHRGGDGCRERRRCPHKDRADCDELLSGAHCEPADVARSQLGPADGARRSSHRAGGRVLVRRLGHLREPVPPQRRQHQRKHPRPGIRHGDRRRDPGNHRRQRRRLRRVRAVQRRRREHHHEVWRQQVLRQLPRVAQQRQVADADPVRDRASGDDT